MTLPYEILRATGAAAVLALAAFVPAAAQTAHTCSGIGEEAEAEAEAFGYSMKLVYAEPDGSYLGETTTVVRQGDTVILEAACPGPWLLMRLPPGEYTAEATYAGQTKEVGFSVGADTVSKRVVTF